MTSLPSPRTALALALGAGLVAGCATPRPLENVDDSQIVGLDEFAERSTDGLWTADALLGLPVRGADGEEIGEVGNLVVGPDDRLRAMIIEVGGVLDIGDTHLRVPWTEIGADPAELDLEYVDTNLASGDLERYDAASNAPADAGDERREWRVDELLGDYVSLEDGTPRDYGIVRDVVFDGDRLESVVVNRSASYGGGLYNYPYRGYRAGLGFDPGLNDYRLGYGTGDLGGYGPFDYGTLGGPL